MKRKFEVTVTEILSRTIEDIEADTLEDAIAQVQKDYENEEIVLDWSDFQESNITGTETSEPYKED